MSEKEAWQGEVLSVQPRIRLLRSFDERAHNYLGYVLRIQGTRAGEPQTFVIAIGKKAHEKHAFKRGDTVSGLGVPVADPRLETADLYKVSALKRFGRNAAPGEAARPGPTLSEATPPFGGVPPELDVYRARGHRRLAARTYASKCQTCRWGAEMAVEMTIDHWNPQAKRYRRESFCYGPKNCRLYKSGPTRKVPGRQGMSYEEEDWVDQDATAHRGPEE